MRVLRMLFAVAALSLFGVAAAEAHSTACRVDRREVRQHARIQHGVQRGALTRGEAARLRTGQAHVRRMERRAAADGRLSPRERARLDRAQDRQGRRIARLSHKGRVR